MYFVDLPGGLGNQLFAYFAGLYIRQQHGVSVRLQYATTSKAHVGNLYNVNSFDLQLPNLQSKLPQTILSPLFYPEKNGITRRIHKTFGFKRVIRFPTGSDTRLHVDEYFERIQPSFFPQRISSYFGDFDFFDNVESQSKKIDLRKKSGILQKYITTFSDRSLIGIHIRAGDYLDLKDSVGLLADNYYQHSISEARELNPDSLVIIFSNDPVYARNRVKRWKLDEFELISPETLPDPAESLVFMSSCNSIITSNSTFSFWAAKLSEENAAVWTPKQWRKDGWPEVNNIPTKWYRVQNSWEV
jgi:hypothetical protein